MSIENLSVNDYFCLSYVAIFVLVMLATIVYNTDQLRRRCSIVDDVIVCDDQLQMFFSFFTAYVCVVALVLCSAVMYKSWRDFSTQDCKTK